MRALRIPDTSVKLTAIQLVMLTIDQLSLVAKQHIQSIIPSLLELSRAQTGNTIPVRIAALACLGRVTGGFQAQVLIPYANTVIKELANVLDDRKRLVRRAAVDCRALWYVELSCPSHSLRKLNLNQLAFSGTRSGRKVEINNEPL